MDERRIVEIEAKLAHQEATLDELNNVVTDQQARLMALETLSKHLLERLKTLGEEGATGSEQIELPPHY